MKLLVLALILMLLALFVRPLRKAAGVTMILVGFIISMTGIWYRSYHWGAMYFYRSFITIYLRYY